MELLVRLIALEIKNSIVMNIAQVPAGFLEVDYEVDIKSPADRSKIKELVNVVNAHCPLLDTLQRPINVNGSVRLNDSPL